MLCCVIDLKNLYHFVIQSEVQKQQQEHYSRILISMHGIT